MCKDWLISLLTSSSRRKGKKTETEVGYHFLLSTAQVLVVVLKAQGCLLINVLRIQRLLMYNLGC